MHYLLAAIIGLVGGVASGLFGVGGGIVMVPAMMYFLGLPIKTAVGTSLVVIIPTTLVGSIKHFQMGNVQLATVFSLAPTAILGGFLGAWLTSQLSDLSLKRMFGGFLVAVGIRLLFFK